MNATTQHGRLRTAPGYKPVSHLVAGQSGPVAKPAPKVSSAVEEISPELARKYLALNIENNRSVNQNSVNTWARMMEQDEWYVAEPIKFDSNGRLIDGQHRLLGVIKSGRTVQFLVVRGMDPKSVRTLDNGRKRTPGNALEIENFPGDTKMAAAALRVVGAYFNGELKHANSTNSRNGSVTGNDVVNMWNQYPYIVDAVKWAGEQRSSMNANPTVVAAGIVVLLHYASWDHVIEFFGALTGNVALTDKDPRQVMRKWLMNQANAGECNSNEYRTRSLFVMIRCWNWWIEGRPSTDIRLRSKAEKRDMDGRVIRPAEYHLMPTPTEYGTPTSPRS